MTAAVARFYGKPIGKQCDIVNKHLGETICCDTPECEQCDTPSDLDGALKDFDLLKIMKPNRPSLGKLIDELTGSRPVAFRYRWDAGDGLDAHFATIIGADRKGRVLVSDPLSKRPTFHDFIDLEDSYRGVDGEWTHVYYVKARATPPRPKAAGPAGGALAMMVLQATKPAPGPRADTGDTMLEREPAPMLTSRTALRIPILDYGTDEVMRGRPAEIRTGQGREALLQGSILYVRRDEKRNYQPFEVDNASALRRFGRLSNVAVSRVKLFRVPGLYVWALWDQGNDELFPVSDRPKFLTDDSYGAEEFFRRLATRALHVVEVRESAKAAGRKNIGG